jgi:hypothetical protein
MMCDTATERSSAFQPAERSKRPLDENNMQLSSQPASDAQAEQLRVWYVAAVMIAYLWLPRHAFMGVGDRFCRILCAIRLNSWTCVANRLPTGEDKYAV